MSDPTPIRLPVDPLAPAAAAVEEAVRVLRGGGLVAYPTDTLYGLGADPRQPEAVERLFRAKGRAADKAVPLVAADLRQVERQVGVLTPLARRLAERFWPGPLTLVIEAAPMLDSRLLAQGETVAVRVPDLPLARALAQALDAPLTATSANRAGAPPPATAAATAAALASAVALVLDGGPTAAGEPSTIVDARGASPVLLRRGVVAWDRVLESPAARGEPRVAPGAARRPADKARRGSTR